MSGISFAGPSIYVDEAASIDERFASFLDMIHGYQQHVTETTRGGNLLDQLITYRLPR